LLPPERELAQRFGVSRTTLRTAIANLALQGRLEVRHGVGTVVTAPSQGESSFDVFTSAGQSRNHASALAEVYALLMGQLAGLAAERVTPATAENVAAAVTAGGSGFTVAIAVASGNLTAPGLIERFHLATQSPDQVHESRSLAGSEQLLLALRRTVQAAISAGDRGAAVGAMELYMTSWRRRSGLL